MEFAGGGCLKPLIPTGVTEEVALRILRQLSSALQYLHRLKVCSPNKAGTENRYRGYVTLGRRARRVQMSARQCACSAYCNSKSPYFAFCTAES
mmetsp:Transcript_40383/g.108379  ORF Transcript_40383/g.108379 Transcript_40383/m.108379 type:complete len:94 (-) Transcript_40383:806-1087(-)